jgi:hypothetical protein
MKEAPDAVLIYIPLMKDLGMSWAELKSTPRIELEGILSAYSEYNLLHAFDGYGPDDIGEMAKKKPEVRSQYASYMEANRNLKERLGKKVQRPSIKDLIG